MKLTNPTIYRVLVILTVITVCTTAVIAQYPCPTEPPACPQPCPAAKCEQPLNLCPAPSCGMTKSAYCSPCNLCPPDSGCCNLCEIPALLDINYKTGEGISGGWLGLMIPILKDPMGMVYADFKTYYDDSDVFSQSFGGGYRKYEKNFCDCAADVIWGVYGYYDRIRSEEDNYFKQGVFGAELLGCNWQIWGNYYLPQTSGESVSITDVAGTITTIDEYGLPGYEVMAGYAFDVCERDRLWVYGGYYDFNRNGFDTKNGPKFAVEYEHFDPFGMTGHTLTFGIEVTNDDIEDTQTFFTVNWLMPLGDEPSYNACCSRTLMCRMREAPRRDFYGAILQDKITTEVPPIPIP